MGTIYRHDGTALTTFTVILDPNKPAVWFDDIVLTTNAYISAPDAAQASQAREQLIKRLYEYIEGLGATLAAGIRVNAQALARDFNTDFAVTCIQRYTEYAQQQATLAAPAIAATPEPSTAAPTPEPSAASLATTTLANPSGPELAGVIPPAGNYEGRRHGRHQRGTPAPSSGFGFTTPPPPAPGQGQPAAAHHRPPRH